MDKETAEEFVKVWRAFGGLRFPEAGMRLSTDNVSNPPTEAEIISAFGAIANFYDVGIIDDAGAHSTYWLILSDGTKYLYESLSIAV